MYAVYKKVLLVLIGSSSCAVFAGNGGSYGNLVGDCNGRNECVVTANGKISRKDRLCESANLSTLWIKGSEKYLIQCRGGDTAEDNVVWIVDTRAGFFGRLDYGRFIKKSTLEKNPDVEIPDQFRARNLCDPIDVNKLESSDFVLLDKRPTDKDDNPYCYAPTYLTLKSGKLAIEISVDGVTRHDPDHAVHSVSTRDRKNLNSLLSTLRQWQPKP